MKPSILFVSKKNTLLLIPIALLIATCALVGIIAYLERSDMPYFPKKSHGVFIQAPTIRTEKETKIIQWTIPEKCDSNGIEFQEIGYRPDKDNFWGGNFTETCTTNAHGYTCRMFVPEDVLSTQKRFHVQVQSYQCTADDYFVSNVFQI